MVRVHTGTMGDNQRVCSCSHGDHTPSLCHAAQPRDVWLDHVHAPRLQQLAEAVPAVLVFSRGQQYATAAKVLPHLTRYNTLRDCYCDDAEQFVDIRISMMTAGRGERNL